MQLGYILVAQTTRCRNYGTCIYSILRNSTISKAQKAQTERNETRRRRNEANTKGKKGKRNKHKIAKLKIEKCKRIIYGTCGCLRIGSRRIFDAS